jgi:UPF0042 nucleotide-binding protein
MSSDGRFVLVTGMSGAGKSQALKFLEDLGYYCVDNLPPALLPKLAELAQGSERRGVAVCVDARGGDDLGTLPARLEEAREAGAQTQVLYLEASDASLVKRYSESRRRHPIARTGSVQEAISRERELLLPMRERADMVIDTSATSLNDFRDRLVDAFGGEAGGRGMSVTVMSFGFKHGVPPEADLVFDVRFLPNPHYVDALRPLTGLDAQVRAYVVDNDEAAGFLERLTALLAYLLPRYEKEPKSYLTIAVGCTGGRHRSVAVAQAVAEFLRGQGRMATLRHRDAQRPAMA